VNTHEKPLHTANRMKTELLRNSKEGGRDDVQKQIASQKEGQENLEDEESKPRNGESKDNVCMIS